MTCTSLLVLFGHRIWRGGRWLPGLPRITEFRRVVQHENRAICRSEALEGRLKMPGQNRISFTRPLERNRYAALVFVQSWQASGMVWPSLAANCPTSFRNRRPVSGHRTGSRPVPVSRTSVRRGCRLLSRRNPWSRRQRSNARSGPRTGRASGFHGAAPEKARPRVKRGAGAVVGRTRKAKA